MSSPRSRGFILPSAAVALVALLACSEGSEMPTASGDSPGLRYGKGGATTGPAVSSATPAYGERGETGKPVTITGSGFSAGATVTWERNGAVDPAISVQSAVVVSSTRIDATISIAAEAELSFYDIGVMNLDRKKGVGTESFEVTTATSIGTLGGNTSARAANDNTTGPRVVGYSMIGPNQHAFYWPAANGQMADLGIGDAEGIDQNGSIITGNSGGYGVLWTLSNGWAATRLPVTTGAPGSRAEWLESGPDGSALFVGGSEYVKGKGNSKLDRPRLWKYNPLTGAWDKLVLSMPRTESNAYSWVKSVNAAGQASGAVRVGAAGSQVVFWDSDGSATILPGPIGGTASGGINATGTIIAGSSDGGAAYWTRIAGGAWSGPYALPGGCGRATGIDHNDTIIGNLCPNSANRHLSAVWAPPYDAANMTTLRGLGDKSDAGAAFAISPQGTLIAGGASSGSVAVGVIWEGGLF